MSVEDRFRMALEAILIMSKSGSNIELLAKKALDT